MRKRGVAGLLVVGAFLTLRAPFAAAAEPGSAPPREIDTPVAGSPQGRSKASTPDPSVVAASPAVATTGYGGWILASDVASAWLTSAGFTGRLPSGFAFLGLGGWVLGPGVIHGVHGNGGAVTPSVLLRLGLPVLGAVAGAYVSGGGVFHGSADAGANGPGCGLVGCGDSTYVSLGFVLGAVFAIAADQALAYFDTSSWVDRPGSSARSSSVMVAPSALLAARSVGAGISLRY